VHVVRGNNDGPDVAAWGAPEPLELDLAGLAVAMVHDSGPAGCGAAARPRGCSCSGILTYPLDQAGHGIHLFNPGSPTDPTRPTDRRRQARGTFGLLHIDDGLLVEARIISVET